MEFLLQLVVLGIWGILALWFGSIAIALIVYVLSMIGILIYAAAILVYEGLKCMTVGKKS